MKILVFAPNAGVSFGGGGGSNFTVKLANSMSEMGHDVTIAGYHVWPREKLESYHGKIDAKITGDEDVLKSASRIPWKLSAYSGLLAFGFNGFIRRTLQDDYDAVWFQDDIPKAAEKYLDGRNIMLYVHFPFMARGKLPDRSLAESINEWLLRRIAGRILVRRPQDHHVKIFCNSTLTQTALKMMGVESEILYIYVNQPSQVNSGPRDKIVISLGNIQTQKRQLDIIEAFNRSKMKNDGWELHLVGAPRDKGYLAKVSRISGSQVKIRGMIPQSELVELFQRASVLVHAAVTEQFGLAPLEGMSYGVYPIVRDSDESGVWTDGTEHGRFCRGYSSIDELIYAFDSVDQTPITDGQRFIVMERSRSFSKELFDAKVKGALSG